MPKANALRAAYAALRAQSPHLYLREAAQQLGVSEMELLRLDVGETVIRLRPEIPLLLEALPTLGTLKALSRNQWVVIETTGPYPQPYTEGPVMVFTSPLIDLRVYLTAWKYAFAVRSFGRNGNPLYSIQFFTAWGEAIHKVYLTTPDQVPLWEALVERFCHSDQSPELEEIAQPPVVEYFQPLPPADIQEGFLSAWNSLKDTHEFFGLLRRFGLSRHAAMEIAEGQHAWRLSPSIMEQLLRWVVESQTPIMFFVGNAGIHQIYSGTIHTLSPARGWINILDPAFNLHLDPKGIGSVWLVRKPTAEGDIYSIEVFGPQGEEILWIFGARKPGSPVPVGWLELIERLRSMTVGIA